MENSILEKIRNSDKHVIVFGASIIGRWVYRYLSESSDLKHRMFFCDNFKSGTDKFTGAEILKPSELAEKYFDAYVIVCVANPDLSKQIFDQLKQMYFPFENIFSIEQISPEIREENNGGFSWKEEEQTYDWTITRGQIEQTAKWIERSDKSVIDFGAGDEHLKNLLNSDVKYIPTDYFARSENTLVYDFDKDPFPNISADVSVLNQILYYPKDWKNLLENVCNSTRHSIVIHFNIYHDTNKWLLVNINSFTTEDVVEIVTSNGFALAEELIKDESRMLREEVGLLFRRKEN